MAGRRSSVRRSVGKRLSFADRQFLDLVLGDADSTEDYHTAYDDDCCDFASLPSSPGARRFFNLCEDSDDEAPSSRFDALPGLDAMYSFDNMKKLLVDFADQDDEQEDDSGDLEGQYAFDQYSFDVGQVARALQHGASLEELVSVIETGMAENLGARLALAETGEAADFGAQPVMGDVTGLMTPPTSEPKPVCPAELAARLTRCRRSSVADCPRLMAAVNQASARHRRSMAEAVTEDLSESPADPARVRQSVAAARRQHRLSLIKAAEVLEVVEKMPETQQMPEEQVESQLNLLQRAVEVARRRHRLSIMKAVEEVTGVDGPSLVPESAASKCTALPVVRQAVVAAYAKKHNKELSNKNALALMHTRVGGIAGKPAHYVHCGPLRTQHPPNRAVRRLR